MRCTMSARDFVEGQGGAPDLPFVGPCMLVDGHPGPCDTMPGPRAVAVLADRQARADAEALLRELAAQP